MLRLRWAHVLLTCNRASWGIVDTTATSSDHRPIGLRVHVGHSRCVPSTSVVTKAKPKPIGWKIGDWSFVRVVDENLEGCCGEGYEESRGLPRNSDLTGYTDGSAKNTRGPVLRRDGALLFFAGRWRKLGIMRYKKLSGQW